MFGRRKGRDRVTPVLRDLAGWPRDPTPGGALHARMQMSGRQRDRFDLPATVKALRQLTATQAGQLGTIETILSAHITNMEARLDRLGESLARVESVAGMTGGQQANILHRVEGRMSELVGAVNDRRWRERSDG